MLVKLFLRYGGNMKKKIAAKSKNALKNKNRNNIQKSKSNESIRSSKTNPEHKYIFYAHPRDCRWC